MRKAQLLYDTPYGMCMRSHIGKSLLIGSRQGRAVPVTEAMTNALLNYRVHPGRDGLRTLAETLACTDPGCRAPAGQSCHTMRGYPRAPHALRERAAKEVSFFLVTAPEQARFAGDASGLMSFATRATTMSADSTRF